MARISVIEKEKCNPIGCGNYLCERVCPVNRTGKECITTGADKKPVIDEEMCTGCGICPNRCPFEAIHIINLPEELKDRPIHQYGENGFRLYNLPIPIFGKVVGVLGRNAIGKSTAIKILAGAIKPNLGKIEDKDVPYSDIIAFFKGTEAQLFFEKIKKGEIRVSYKPQQVDLIPKTAKGKVIDLLRKVDEKGRLENIAEELGIGKILENDIKEISGGEMQRVAIAATVLKKANLYIFDEPTSYLDIKQRIKVAKFIRGLADDDTSVIVIEHDLIILDYMTDIVHLMYGKEGAYGIVSLPKSTRAGINVYLGGYMKEENIRFREKAIKFFSKKEAMKTGKESITSWENIRKNLGRFSLNAEKGAIHRHEVTGILGENGIGKTTFVKMLAGLIKPDSGDVTKKIRVAYKPQYIESGSGETVMGILKDALKKYEVQIIRPLNLKHLLPRKVSEMSGGELQRVAIADTLSRDADLFLIDEPSAHLDVEQRLLVSKIIRENMEKRGKSALVVEHDLLFIDYLSENLIVFDGEPAVTGSVNGPFSMEEGMNLFLKDINLTFRRDPDSNRPRANKPGSQMDQKQKKEGNLYYV